MNDKIIPKLVYHILRNPRIRYSKIITAFRYLIGIEERKNIIDNFFRLAVVYGVNGDYLEFGCYKGDSAILAYYTSKKHHIDMNLYLFDSFQGLPKLIGVDKLTKYHKEGDSSCHIDKFKKNLKKSKVDMNKVNITEGFFKNTLNESTKKKLKLKKASIIVMDCDLYESTKDALNFITDYVREGTLILLVDWFLYNSRKDRGQQKAFYEWLNKNKNITATQFMTLDSFVLHLEHEEKEGEDGKRNNIINH